ncbi:hypothetical protein BDN72DRAFT_960925 [Pluteus cervinus]|uniref:Uncharacterized protein n=1 Tax=Pluteus cervinus TaxID=181527 RepID=A0ACD3APU8_9AGAR|nr:hypothetical protein BDN72DRAFT_960925 [Pluteus cervinus]
MSSPQHWNYAPPSLADHPLDQEELMTLLVYAYSRTWNKRRLENHFYGFWNRALQHFLAEFKPVTILVPQQLLSLPIDEFQGSLLEGSPDRSANELPVDLVANRRVSTGTQQGRGLEERTPDFTAFLTRSRKRAEFSSQTLPTFCADFYKMEMLHVCPLILAELKRPPPRFSTLETFTVTLGSCFKAATKQVSYAANIAFETKMYAFDRLVLIATAGDWWGYQVATREHYEKEYQSAFREKLGLGDEDESSSEEDHLSDKDYKSDEEEDEALESRNRQHKAKVEEESGVKEPISPAESRPSYEWEMQSGLSDLTLVDKAGQTYTNCWSAPARYGTKVSNQRFWILNQLLQQIYLEYMSSPLPALEPLGVPLADDTMGGDGFESEPMGFSMVLPPIVDPFQRDNSIVRQESPMQVDNP